MNPLMELKKLGQSVWYDNIRRGLITTGELRRMIAEYGITGVTSNPTIFEKAVSGTEEYDGVISELAAGGLSDIEVLDELIMRDIREGADILGPVFEATKGRDGFISIEVRPSFAKSAEETMDEARRFFSAIRKPNLMVKVPATVEGLRAVEELTYEGCNINITLLFSVRRYEEVAKAYIRGLERRAAEGRPVEGISSVASFFVSRVDTLADMMIEERIERASSNDEKARLRSLLGKVAIANAKLAYAAFREIFQGERFKALRDKGASEQRLLWASTGTKNPQYPDVKYVEGLIEKNTVNTMPLQTMLAYYGHGRPRVTLSEGLDEARRVIDGLAEAGVGYDAMTARLEEEGIRGFGGSFEKLLSCVSEKKAALIGKRGYAMACSFGGFEPGVKEALHDIGAARFLERLWAKDPTLWKDDPEHKKIIRQALGWLNLPDIMRSFVDGINGFAGEIRDEGFRDVVLLGMGGSSLAPLVLKEAFGPVPGYPRLRVLDSTDPDAIRAVEGVIDPERTLFIFSSKSGTTIEPLSLFEYFYGKLHGSKGEGAGGNFIAITDPGTALEGFSRKYRFRKLFLNPADIGGRFSALSFFGLVPAALAGIDISRLLDSAAGVSAATHPCVEASGNPVLLLGAALGSLAAAGRDKLTFFLPGEISSFGLWIEQLVAESTGKEGRGIVPVTGEPAGGPESYGDDRVFIYVGLGSADNNIVGRLEALASAGHPVIRFVLKDLWGLGGEFLRWEVATAAAGAILGIDPFDQPDVELAKKLTLARLNTKGERKDLKPPGVEFGATGFKAYFGNKAFEMMAVRDGEMKDALRGFMGLIREGDYLGVLAYYDPEDKTLSASFAGLRERLRDLTKSATQFGYGPRYLHSTGQLHKGGVKKGVFIILCHQAGQDLRIPGRDFSFSELELSQAFGDMEALDSKGCRVMLLDLKDSSLKALAEAEEELKNAFQ